MRLRVVFLAALWWVAAIGAAQGASNIDLLARSGWKLNGLKVASGSSGYRVGVNRDVAYGWAEIHLPVDVATYPLIRVQVEGANPKAKWSLKIQFPPRQEEWLITDNDQNGTFSFPIGEYLGRYDKGDCIVRFFAIGRGAAICPFFTVAAGLNVSLPSQATGLPLIGSRKTESPRGTITGLMSLGRANPPSAQSGRRFRWSKAKSDRTSTVGEVTQ